MFFASLGLLYGAPSSIARLWFNQSAAALGNLVGGALFVGLTAHLMNHWKSPIFAIEGAGTLLGHDLESTRRAKEDGHVEDGTLNSSIAARTDLDERHGARDPQATHTDP